MPIALPNTLSPTETIFEVQSKFFSDRLDSSNFSFFSLFLIFSCSYYFTTLVTKSFLIRLPKYTLKYQKSKYQKYKKALKLIKETFHIHRLCYMLSPMKLVGATCINYEMHFHKLLIAWTSSNISFPPFS